MKTSIEIEGNKAIKTEDLLSGLQQSGLAEGESPESIGPHNSWINGFRALASRAPE